MALTRWLECLTPTDQEDNARKDQPLVSHFHYVSSVCSFNLQFISLKPQQHPNLCLSLAKKYGQSGLISCIAVCPDNSGLYALGSYSKSGKSLCSIAVRVYNLICGISTSNKDDSSKMKIVKFHQAITSTSFLRLQKAIPWKQRIIFGIIVHIWLKVINQ